ncbi:RNA polymerase sigma-70 factor (ECF subfamily) [Rhodococcus sp. OK611]|uniref:sigma-70 family RNA polymerase sigma factor n=1 Tax=unclassified Rhodococcus (in: high G+C Gram-positive bacteria) TaxID=192944 RepID=UPI000BCB68B4|nr:MULTISPECIES: sigma-70 family RNA polymerase sigma factor [unclassified Rhodococcus (in: high G+C Gram-positive bacteria)]PTR41937.1 RNA polymerase sigma-70 factor (ECF subfamily) [Rhodococcus sp. OK611]SNX91616.1 RNA polymerase sigma-70 factor, ECF subfamily [Rhodococcus sp. OK270]
MDGDDFLAEEFEAHSAHLRAVAYRMLGSVGEAEDAVQETWLRFSRADTDDVRNLGGWLTTVLARVCLNLLRARGARRETLLGVHLPDPIVGGPDDTGPEHEALLADSVGLALLVVLDTLPPAERLAFVLHDMFAVPFDDIAPIVDRSPEAARQLASRARRRVRSAPVPDTDRPRQREVVDAFLAAARGGDLDRLVALLDPDVVLRTDAGAAQAGVPAVVTGAPAVAARTITFSRLARFARPVLVNGTAGVVTIARGRVLAVVGVTIRRGRIAEIDILSDRRRLGRIAVEDVD